MFRRFMIVSWVLGPLLAIASDQQQEDYVTPQGLYCGPLIKHVNGDLNELLDRYEALKNDEIKCVVMHMEICPDFLMRQCKEKGWGKGISGGCEHILGYDRNFHLLHYIEYCEEKFGDVPEYS